MPAELHPSRIEHYREEIDRIDSQLLQLLNRRAACALSIGRIKKSNDLPVYVPEREQKVLARMEAENEGPCSDESVRRVFLAIFAEMKALEEATESGAAEG